MSHGKKQGKFSVKNPFCFNCFVFSCCSSSAIDVLLHEFKVTIVFITTTAVVSFLFFLFHTNPYFSVSGGIPFHSVPASVTRQVIRSSIRVNELLHYLCYYCSCILVMEWVTPTPSACSLHHEKHTFLSALWFKDEITPECVVVCHSRK